MRRHLVWVWIPVALAAVTMLCIFLRAGLDDADKLSSVVAALIAVVSVGFSVVSLLQDRHSGEARAPRSLGYGRRYLRWARNSIHNPQGSRDPIGQFTPTLGEIYVDVSVVPRAPGMVGGGVVDKVPLTVTQRHSVWDFLKPSGPHVVAVLGIPGGGKSTLLRHVTWALSRRTRPRGFRLRRHFPVLIELRTVAEAMTSDNPPDLAYIVADTVGLGDAHQWWRAKLTKGAAIVLLDGFDEVVSPEDRAATAQWIDRQTSRYNRTKFVIASRPYGLIQAAPKANIFVQVRSFTDTQVSLFLQKWFLAAELSDPTAAQDRRQAQRTAQSAANDLFRLLMDSRTLHDLTINPLLLSMIADVHRSGSELPNSRAELYDAVCRRVLNPPPDIDPLMPRISEDARERLLGAVAADFMRRKVSIGSASEVRAALGTAAPGSPPPDEFLDFSVRTGMLVKNRADGRYSFAHLTFQEYLCARHIHRNPSQISVLEGGVDDVWWHEVTLLWAAKSSPDRVVAACLHSGRVRALSLATACIDMAPGRTDPDLVAQVSKHLSAAFNPAADTVHQRLVAGVLAVQHVRRSTATSEGTRLATSPVTTDLYSLFLSLTRNTPPDAACAPQPGDPVPAIGMWASDAAAFVRWVNSLEDVAVESLYRLPTTLELLGRHSRLRLGLRQNGKTGVVWSTEAGAPNDDTEVDVPVRIWLADRAQHPYHVSESDIERAVARDLVASPDLRQILSAGIHGRVRLISSSIRAIQERATTVHSITLAPLRGGLRVAKNDLVFARADGSKEMAEVRRAERAVAAWTRALDRAAKNAPGKREMMEEEWPARARRVLFCLHGAAEDAESMTRQFDRRGADHPTPDTVDAAAELLHELTKLQQILDRLAHALDPALHREARDTLRNGWPKVHEAQQALKSAQQLAKSVAAATAWTREVIDALPSRQWRTFLPSAAKLQQVQLRPYRPGL